MEHTIIVGNIGTVYSGTNSFMANLAFNRYVGYSKRGHSKITGESVTWFKDSDIHKEYIGPVDLEEHELC